MSTNALGLDGFEFVELTSPDPAAMEDVLARLGFTPYAVHPTRDVVRWKQGAISVLVDRERSGHAAEFRAAHGPSASAMAFRVADPRAAFEAAVARGATPADEARCVLRGVGGSLLHLVDRRGGDAAYPGWKKLPGADAMEAANGVGLVAIDHLTHNVRRGEMRRWSEFYARVFGFTEQMSFDIRGKQTALWSQAMIAPDAKIRIPLNESQDDRSQVEEFLRRYGGEGIQHVALATNDIYATVEALRRRGIAFQGTVDTYYDLVDARLPDHGEDIERMKRSGILIDGEKDGLLLQIFTTDLFGPIFFEIIQRKGNEGFGNGNFQALFESIELDQTRRGVLPVQA